MLIQLDRARQWYEILLRRIKNKKKKAKVIILVSPSIDSLTSVRIIVGLFKSDIIPYEIIPILNTENLTNQLENLKTYTFEIIGMIFINCVGQIDLTNYWFYKKSSKDILILITDSRRPIYHKLINDKSIFVLIDDLEYDISNCPSNEDYDNFENEDFESNENEDNDNKNDDGENHYEVNNNNDNNNKENNENSEEKKEEEKKEKRKKLKRKITENIEEELQKEEDEEEEELRKSTIKNITDSNIITPKKLTYKEEEMTKEQLKKEKMKKVKEQIDYYYYGTYYGLPSTYIFYSIAHELHKESNTYLWYLIVAVTDEYLRKHITEQKYEEMKKICQNEVTKITKRKKKEEKESKYSSTSKEVKSILIGTDYRLCLYRHWNLYDSFIYSNYPLGVLSTWKEQGKNEVQKLFAYVGIPLSEAKQKYRYMRSEYKDSFKSQITEISRKFDLRELIFHSFIYQFDQNIEMSASDCVYLISSLLEYPFDSINDIEVEDDDFLEDDNYNKLMQKISNDNYTDDDNSEIKTDLNIEIVKKKRYEDNWIKKFWLAYKFLSLKKLNMTNSLIDLSIKFQITLANNSTMVIDKNGIIQSQSFRYSIINSNLSDESKYFHYPGNLERLTELLIEIYKRNRKDFIEKPSLLAFFDAETKTYFVNGIGNDTGMNNKNDFYIKFIYVVRKLGIKMNFSFCNDEIVSIGKEDLYRFIEEISNIQ